MKLVIREYLTMLKESGELDVLLPDLLLNMGIEPLSKPQQGVRQDGVDIPAVGLDPDNNNTKTLFLFIIKAGNVDRSNWDNSKQGVRSSLNEIMDVYLTTHVEQRHQSLPKKIVLCFNGEIKQEAESNWIGYVKNNIKPGKVEFALWNADKLSILIERYFLDEYLFPEKSRKKLRKTLAMLDLSEYDLSHFYALLEEILFKSKLPKKMNASAGKKRLKAIRLIHLSGEVS